MIFSAATAHAQGWAQGDWYVKGFGGATWPQDQTGDVNGVAGSPDGKARYDTGYTLGAALGYEYTPNFALEIEYAYRRADTTTDIDGLGDFGGDTNSNAVMFNALYKFSGMGATGAIQPYVGGGIGWANMESDINNIGSFKRDNAFAYQVMGGVGYDVTPNWTLLGEVRWFATDQGDLDGPDGLSWDGVAFETIDLLVGATYRF